MGKPRTYPFAAAYTIAFVCVLWLPLLALCFDWDKTEPLFENRKLAEKPALQFDAPGIRAFPKAFEAYFNDHLGFRNALIRCQDWIKFRYLGVAGNPKVLLGKEDWLYLAGDSLTYKLAASPLTDEQLARWKEWLESRREWLAKRNIRFLVVVAPTKSSVYPEHLPDWVRKANPQTRWEQLREYLAQRSDVPVLDLTETLLQEKKQHQVFFQTDSHWNGIGAFAGAQTILSTLQREGVLPAQAGPRYLLDRSGTHKGDLAKMLGIENHIVESSPLMVPEDRGAYDFRQKPEGIITWDPDRKDHLPFAIENGTVKGPNAVFFHDSFGDGLTEYLAVGFKRIVFVHTGRGFDTTLIEHEKPDVVVWQMVERYLQLRVP